MPLQWLLVTDVDDTLLGNEEALRRFATAAEVSGHFDFVLNSSRPVASVERTLRESRVVLRPAAVVGAMGTEVAVDGKFDSAWSRSFGSWDRAPVDRLMKEFGAIPHDNEYQTSFKASYDVSTQDRDRIIDAIEALEQPCRIVVSGISAFDVLPPTAGKGAAAIHCLSRFGDSNTRLVVAGDSANDIDLFSVAHFGIVVGNARAELKNRVDASKTTFAEQHFADGILEGLILLGAIPANSVPTLNKYNLP